MTTRKTTKRKPDIDREARDPGTAILILAPPTMKAEILQVQTRFWEALKSKDLQTLEAIMGDPFISRSPGEPDQQREQFINALVSFPGHVLDVGSDNLKAHQFGEVAILSGVQSATIRLPNGTEIIDTLAITNVLQHSQHGWQLVFCHTIQLPTQE